MPNRRLDHDLKNELGIVLGFAQVLLTEMNANDPARSDVLEIQAAAERAMRLLGRLGSGEPGIDTVSASHPDPGRLSDRA